MGLDIWFKFDIANILRAVEGANLSALALGLPLLALTGGASSCLAGHRREVTRAGITRLVDSPRR